MRSSEQTNEIAPAWVAALNELEDVIKDKVANAGSYKYAYADLATAAQQARKVLAGHSLAVHQQAHGDSLGSVQVTTRAWHTSGQWIEAEPLVMPAKGGPQDVGSAITYCRRYALMSFLGLATEDDDGESAQKAAKEADKPHPLSERVANVTQDMRRLTDTAKEALKAWADGRKLTPNALLTSEPWLIEVENWLSAYEHDQQGTLV